MSCINNRNMPYSALQYATALFELEQTQTKEQQEQTLQTLLKHLAHTQQQGLLQDIIAKLENLKKQSQHQQTIYVTTAQPITDNEKKRVQEMFGEAQYIFKEDQGLIAGIVIQKQNTVFYNTLKTTINGLKKQLHT